MYEANEGNFNVKSSVAHSQDYCRCCLRPLNPDSRQKMEAVLRLFQELDQNGNYGEFQVLGSDRNPFRPKN